MLNAHAYSLGTPSMMGGGGSGGVANGSVWQHLSCPEDLREEHNTTYDSRGTIPYHHVFVGQGCEGFVSRNNLEFWSADGGFTGLGYEGTFTTQNTPDYSGLVGTALMSAALPNSVWDHNVVVGGWSDSNALTDETSAAITTLSALYPASPGTIFVNGSTVAARSAAVNFFNYSTGNMRLSSASSYISGGALHGTDGLDVGANIDALEAAQGRVSNVHVVGNPLSTSVAIGFLAPDAAGCTVDWSTDAWTSWTRAANAGGGRVQVVTLSPITAHALVAYQVNCQVMTPIGSVQLP